jgi:lysophospholipase L1-like esterase
MKKIASLAWLLLLVSCDKGSLPTGAQTSLTEAEISEPAASVSSGTEQAGATRAVPFKRILCFGDSITYGVTSRSFYGWTSLVYVQGYVPKLRRKLVREYGEGITLINSGVGAEDTASGLRRLSGELKVFNPDLVLLLEGIVDVNSPNPRVDEARANLKRMMEMTLREGSACIIGTYIPLNNEGFRARGKKGVAELNEAIRREAAKLSVPVADHEEASEQNMSLQGPDGLHPNDDGYRLMAETWFQAIQDLVAESET